MCGGGGVCVCVCVCVCVKVQPEPGAVRPRQLGPDGRRFSGGREARPRRFTFRAGKLVGLAPCRGGGGVADAQ